MSRSIHPLPEVIMSLESAGITEREIEIPVGSERLHGTLAGARNSTGLVLFAHGSGSSRFSPRNRQVARALNESGFSTLLLDLLTRQEEVLDARSAHLRFDIGFLAGRLAAATRWAAAEGGFRDRPIGYFGASTGAAAALVAASDLPELISAVVSRGGRPDLADAVLPIVRAPTLLIVGGRDFPVIEMNREAYARLTVEKHMEIVPGATHLFEEPGALEEVARLATEWFLRFLAPSQRTGAIAE